MSAKGKLNGLEKRIRTLTGAEPDEATRRRREKAVYEWVEYRAGLRPTHGPAVLDSPPIPPPDFPAPPPGLARDLWADALDAAATFSARVAYKLGAGDHLPGASERARRMAEAYSLIIRLALVRPGDDVPRCFADPPPRVDEPPPDETAARHAVMAEFKMWWVYSRPPSDCHALDILARRAAGRLAEAD